MIPDVTTVLYADPPWAFRNVRTGGCHTSGSAQQYPVLSTEALCAVHLAPLVRPDAALFLWTPVPIIEDGLAVMRAWNFRYHTTIFWHKTRRFGLGYWFRGEVELLLFGTRGCVPAFRSSIRNWEEHPWIGHSRKPEAFRHRIEQATVRLANPHYIELFARRPVPGWLTTGLEVDGVDVTAPGWWDQAGRNKEA